MSWKLSRTVLKSSHTGDCVADFNSVMGKEEEGKVPCFIVPWYTYILCDCCKEIQEGNVLR